MKLKTKIMFLILGLFLIVFFFKLIPIPVENISGIKNPDKFIFGGFYWTSILYQLSVKNYIGVSGLCSIFLILFGGNYLLDYKK